MKLFITGGRGMVGRNLAVRAEQQGFTVIAPNRDEVDLMDFASIKAVLSRDKPDLVVHAAGLVGGIQANMAAPYDFCLQNLQIGTNVVRAAHETGIAQLINLGSSCMYPRNAKNPLSEEQILQGELEPTNEGYAVAKIAVAKLCQYLGEQHDRHYRTLIPCNLYGAWDNFHPERSHMIPGVIRKIHEAKDASEGSVDIWGDGSARREFMFVEDLADMILASADRVKQLPPYLNVGLGYDYSINEYYQEIAAVVGYDGGFTHDLSKPAGMKQKLVDINDLEQLGWRAPTTLRAGIEKTYDFFKKEVL
ncbi:MAG: GDP-L-fucose synthase [Motiliproteus sp.]|nr:GDP-L-fucose synthase [Motiliproteus sp.]MCW9053451.1 GDP-L-fucose synthase [Motiliproteus sp.]